MSSLRKAPRAVVASIVSRLALSLVSTLAASAAHATPRTLDAIQALAAERAPRLLVAREAARVASAELVAADPSLPDNAVLELSLGPRASSAGLGVAFAAALTQSVFVDGQRAARVAAAKKAALAAEAEVVVAFWALHADLHEAFDRAVVARERAALLAEVEAFLARLADIAHKKAKAGEIATLDARLSEIALVEARQRTLAARTDYRLACLELTTLVGADLADPLEPDGALTPPPLPALAALRARALELEPELRVKVALVALAEARLAAARADAGVTPAFGLAVGHEGGLGAEPSVTTVQALVSLPLPFSQRNQGAIARARAELALSEAERAAREQVVAGRVTLLHAALAAAIARVAVFGADLVPRVGENLALLERGYALGELGLTDTLVARERFTVTRLDALDAEAASLSARAELERLLGADLEEVTK